MSGLMDSVGMGAHRGEDDIGRVGRVWMMSEGGSG